MDVLEKMARWNGGLIEATGECERKEGPDMHLCRREATMTYLTNKWAARLKTGEAPDSVYLEGNYELRCRRCWEEDMKEWHEAMEVM